MVFLNHWSAVPALAPPPTMSAVGAVPGCCDPQPLKRPQLCSVMLAWQRGRAAADSATVPCRLKQSARSACQQFGM
eukprot:1052388-Alexandrium_andersonii.AAC.1